VKTRVNQRTSNLSMNLCIAFLSPVRCFGADDMLAKLGEMSQLPPLHKPEGFHSKGYEESEFMNGAAQSSNCLFLEGHTFLAGRLEKPVEIICGFRRRPFCLVRRSRMLVGETLYRSCLGENAYTFETLRCHHNRQKKVKHSEQLDRYCNDEGHAQSIRHRAWFSPLRWSSPSWSNAGKSW
jgi:hypothetical protein